MYNLCNLCNLWIESFNWVAGDQSAPSLFVYFLVEKSQVTSIGLIGFGRLLARHKNGGG